ncbi:hypothetical protein OG809_02330 [Kribbella soli]
MVERLAPLGRVGAPEVVLPSDEVVGRLCARLAIGVDDRDSLLGDRPDAVHQPELWWVLSCSYRLLLAQMRQRRRGDPAWAPLERVFHRRYDGPVVPPSLLGELPQRTALERAIVAHLRRGGHWYSQTGWIRRPRASSRGKWLGA